MKRQRGDFGDMAEVDFELTKRVRSKVIRDEVLDGARQPKLVEAELDRHFPAACQAQQALVGRSEIVDLALFDSARASCVARTCRLRYHALEDQAFIDAVSDLDAT